LQRIYDRSCVALSGTPCAALVSSEHLVQVLAVSD
jgi:hypothetical protein